MKVLTVAFRWVIADEEFPSLYTPGHKSLLYLRFLQMSLPLWAAHRRRFIAHEENIKIHSSGEKSPKLPSLGSRTSDMASIKICQIARGNFL